MKDTSTKEEMKGCARTFRILHFMYLLAIKVLVRVIVLSARLVLSTYVYCIGTYNTYVPINVLLYIILDIYII